MKTDCNSWLIYLGLILSLIAIVIAVFGTMRSSVKKERFAIVAPAPANLGPQGRRKK